MRNLYLSLSIILFLPFLATAQPCECTNCPVSITDNGTFYGYLDVNVSGPNDLGQCPLQQVCFQITHTWVGDLSVTLISPSGLNYLIMADSDNNTGGCGNDNDNIDVCIDVGTGNPLTNNTDYICNGGNPCLVGNWTVPCGGVTDPISGAVQAPNCDLDDFNVPGDPANGTWTLVINDICAQDTGSLNTWSLVFACGVNSCVTCEANGGTLNQADVSGCMPNPGLNLNINPTYPGGNPPPASDYSYTFVYTLNGIIMGFVDGPNLNNLPPGTYQVCGLSYLTADAGLYNVYIGQPYTNLVNDLNNASAGFCGDLSTDCFNATIHPVILPTVVDTAMCIGDCFTTPTGLICCSPGGCQYTLPASTGCDSTIIVNIAPLFPNNVQITETVCPNECININGTDYCPPGVYILQLTNQQGCDSIVQLSVLPVPVTAVIASPPPITCDMPAVLLDGSNSNGNTFEWQNSNGQTLGTLPTVTVNQTGTYSLIVGNTLNGVTCYDTAQVTVTENLILPNQPILSGPTTVCQGDNSSYTITNVETGVTYTWTIPAGTSIITGGDGFPNISIQWNTPIGGDICVVASNTCGSSPPECISVTVESPPQPPQAPSGPVEVCNNSSSSYSIPPAPGATSYVWSIPAGANITSGQGTTDISIAWGNSSGGQLCVYSSNNCGNSADVCIDITTISPPFQPSLNGPNTACENDTLAYNLIPAPNATGYTWSIPACATLIAGQGSSSILVAWPVGCTGGNICATADNACGSSAQTCLHVNVQPLATPPVLSGPLSVCQNDLSTYSLQAVAGATSYSWNVSGGSIQSGQGTTSIQVLWNTPGSGQVCASATTSCGQGLESCLNISIDSIPQLQPISGNNIICAGVTETYTIPSVPEATGYTWTTTCGSIISGQGTNSIQIDWTGCPTGGQVCVSADVPCGTTAPSCMDVNGGTIPATPLISGPPVGCFGGLDTFCVNTDPNVSSYNWTFNNLIATIVSGQGTDCIVVQWNDGNQTGQVCVTATNGCGNSPQACMDIIVPDYIPISIDGPSTLCVNDTATYLASQPVNNWNIDCGTIIASTSSSVTVVWDAGTTNCQVCATYQQCFGPETQCNNINVLPPPTPDAGPDDATCGLSIQLNASGNGQWSMNSGPGNASFSDPTDPLTIVNVDAYGPYTFSWTQNNGYCSSSDYVTINFNDDPAIVSAITETCTADALFYSVSFTIGSGQAPYTVTGSVPGTLSGNTFTSDLIPDGTPYSFDITDANNCGPINVSGIYVCNCITNAGTMPPDTLSLCTDEPAQVQMPADTTLDGDDLALFALHEDNGTNGLTLGNIIAINNTGTFDFLPGQMTAEQTYYISVIVGDNDGNGQIDMNDPCLSISNGQPVIWHALPQVSLAEDATVCEGETAMIPVAVTANGCIDLEVQLSNGDLLSFSCLYDGDFISIPTGQDNLSVQIIGITDANGCQNNSASTATITVNITPSATITSAASVCNSTDSGSLPTSLNFDDFITGGDATGSWENTDGVAVSGDFPLLNFEGATPGQYTFTYTTGSALPPCENVAYTIEITVEDCVCPGLELNPAPDLCNDGDVLDLSGLSANAAPGNWSITGTPAGNNPATLNGTLLDAAGADAGTYQLTYTLAQTPPSGCPVQNSVSLNISQALSAGTPTQDVALCFGESQTINLFDLLQNADSGGSWQEVSDVPSTGAAFNAAAGTFQTNNQAAGYYLFRYTVVPEAPCQPDMVEVGVLIHPLPAADAGPDRTLTCFEPLATLGGDNNQAGPVSYSWSSDNGVLPEPPDVLHPTIDVPGTYTLTVTSELTGCQAQDQVVIDDVQDTPSPQLTIKPISCFGFNDGALLIDSIIGGTPPYLISFNGSPFTAQTVFTQLAPAVYSIVVQDINGCQNEPLTINMEQPQELDVSIYAYLDGDNVIVLGDSIELAAQVNVPMEEIDSIMWMPAEILSCDTCFATWAHPLETTTFSVMIESNGCTDEDKLTIAVRKDRPIYVPNAFSPNGDGINDILFINAGPQVAKIKSFLIFNRWGETVFQYYNFPPNDPAFGWDGRHRGQDLNPGVFVWYAEIEFLDGSTDLYKGDIILTR